MRTREKLGRGVGCCDEEDNAGEFSGGSVVVGSCVYCSEREEGDDIIDLLNKVYYTI